MSFEMTIPLATSAYALGFAHGADLKRPRRRRHFLDARDDHWQLGYEHGRAAAEAYRKGLTPSSRTS